MNGKMLVVGGAGDLGRKRILPALRELATPADVVDPRPFAGGFPPGVGAAYRSLDEVPSPASYLGVVVATPNNLHLKHTRWTLETAGLPCLLEKPIAHSLPDARAIADLADGAGVPLWVADHYLAKPSSQFVLSEGPELLRSIGRIERLHGRILEDSGTLAGRDWLRVPTRSGGGIWIDTGIHLVTFILSLLPGEDWEVSKAEASGFDPADPDLAETSFVMFAKSNGMVAAFEVGKAGEAAAKDLQIEGSRGSVTANWLSDTVSRDGTVLFGPAQAAFGGYLTLLDGFVRACHDRSRSAVGAGMVSCALALRALELVKAGYHFADLPRKISNACQL